MDVHLFPGQGSQYKGMTSLLQSDPWVSELIARAEAWAWQLLGCRFGDYLRSGTTPDHDYVQSFLCDQLRIFLGSLSIHHILLTQGITANWRIGHSLGEISALTAAGWMDLDTALKVVCMRSKAIVDYAPTGGMTAVQAPMSRVQEALKSCQDLSISLSTSNSPSQSTVSGLTADLDRFEAVLSAHRITHKRLLAKYPFHGPMMERAAQVFANAIASEITLQGEPVWSAIYNRPYTQHEHLSRLLPTHLVLPVLFCQSISNFAHAGVIHYVEVGGRKALTGLVRDLLKTLDVSTAEFVTTSLPGESEISQLVYACSTLGSGVHHPSPHNNFSFPQIPASNMINLASCSSDELQSLIIAATGELSRRAQAIGVFQARQTMPMGWSQQPGFAGWHPPQEASAWGQPAAAPMAHPSMPVGWMPPAPGWSSQATVLSPAHQPRQEQLAWPSPPAAVQPAPGPNPAGNGHSNGAGLATAPATSATVAAPLTEEKPSSAPQPAQAPPKAPAQVIAQAEGTGDLTAESQPTPTIDHGDTLLNQLVLIYQEATEYPAEILEPDANLEADLGIDSVKQMQVLGLVRERFSFELPEETDMKAMRTIREVADSIRPLAKLS